MKDIIKTFLTFCKKSKVNLGAVLVVILIYRSEREEELPIKLNYTT